MYAYIQNGVAVEVVQSDPFMLFVEGYATQFIEVPDDVVQGSRLVDGDWMAAEPMAAQIPQEVTMRQARLVLHKYNYLNSVQPAIDALTDPPRTAAQIEWDYSNSVRRVSGFTSMIGAAIGLTDSQIDDLFIEAATL